METTILQSTLTDGSKTYAVSFIDGSQQVTIECVSEEAAEALRLALKRHAYYSMIDPVETRPLTPTRAVL